MLRLFHVPLNWTGARGPGQGPCIRVPDRVKRCGMASISSTRHPRRLADYSADYRMLILAAMAVVAGTGGAFSAWALLKLIALATNILWHGRFSFDPTAIAARGALLVLLIPVAGGLIVGLMARFGSDKIRGHGIPEAIETILFGESRLSLKVALLKPLSSAMSIGSGGPFGAEGPIIMTGGAIGSLFAQLFDLSAAERKTLLVAGATAGMTGIFGTPFAVDHAGGRAAAVRMEAAQLRAGRDGGAGRARLASAAGRLGAAVPVRRAAPRRDRAGGHLGGDRARDGLLAAFLSFLLYRIEDGFHRLPIHWMWWPAIGAVVVGIGGLFDIRVLGAGYGSHPGARRRQPAW